jgi:DNA-directed RNA polymerase beta subunit
MEKSDKAKTGNDLSGHSKDFIVDKNQPMPIGRLPVMVNSNLCWLHKDKKSEHKDKKSEYGNKETDCLFDSGGYFLIKGIEKV